MASPDKHVGEEVIMLRALPAVFMAALFLLPGAGAVASAGWIDDDGSGNNWIQGNIAVHLEEYVPGGAILTVGIADRLVNTSDQDLFVRIPLQFARSTWPDGWVGPLEPSDENLWSYTHGGLTKTMQAYDSPAPGDEFMMMDITGVEDIRLQIPDPFFPGVRLNSPSIAPTWDLGVIPAGGSLESDGPFGRILITNPQGLWHIQGTTIVAVVPEPAGTLPMALASLAPLVVWHRLRRHTSGAAR
jgi:hypothetical protein